MNETNCISFSKDEIVSDNSYLDELSYCSDDDSERSAHSTSFDSTGSYTCSYVIDEMLYCHRIESISNQISSLSWKCGSPTAITHFDNNIAVGTNGGVLLLFDEAGHLDRVLRSADCLCPIASLASTRNGLYVAVGFSTGTVKIINARTGSVSHMFPVVVDPGKSLVQVLFFDRVHSFLTLDNSGNVFEVQLKSDLIKGQEERVHYAFPGSNGDVITMKTLPHGVFALVTVNKVLLISSRFGGAVLFSFPLKEYSEYPASVDFREKHHPSFIDLCIAHGSELSVFPHVNCSQLIISQKVTQKPVTVNLPHRLVAAYFFSDHGIAAVDSFGVVIFVDDRNGTFVRSVSSNLLGLPALKTVTADCSVSKIIKCLAENACNQRMVKYGNAITVLTHKGVFKIQKISELDQVDVYRKRADSVSSCLYLCDLTSGRVHCSQTFKKDIESVLITELRSLLLLITGCKADTFSDIAAYSQMSVLLRVCVSCDQFGFLYDVVWPKIERIKHLKYLFLDQLGQFIIEDKMVDIRPWIVSNYLSHLSSEEQCSQIESVLEHVPSTSLDVEVALLICRQHGLYDSVITVMNNLLFDYVSPLEEMMELVSQFALNDVKSDTEVEHGNRLLLYIHCCLAGHAYPFGTLPRSIKDKVPLEVYRCITSLKGKDGEASTKDYPYLRILLLFDAQQLIHVISSCCESPLFQVEGRLQRLTEMIGISANELRTESTLICFLFLIVTLLRKTLIVPRVTIVEESILHLLCMDSQSPMTESIIVDTLCSIPCLNKNVIHCLAHSSMRFTICTVLSLMDHGSTDISEYCATVQTKNPNQLFPVFRNVLSAEITVEKKAIAMKYINSISPKLSHNSAMECAQLVVDFIPEYFSQLDLYDSAIRFQNARLLQSAFRIKRDRGEQSLTGIESLDETLFEIVVEDMISQSSDHNVDDVLEDLVIYWLPLGSRTDYCLNKASEKSYIKTVIVLLEARNHVDRAFEEIYNSLDSSHGEEETLRSLDRSLAFCSRQRHLERQKQWLFMIFEVVIAKSNSLSNVLNSQVESLTLQIISSGSQHSHYVIKRLFECDFFASGFLGSFSSLIDSIFSICSIENAKFTDILHCTNLENSVAFTEDLRLMSRSVITVSPFCVICRAKLSESTSVFQCGHMVHMECFNGITECPCRQSDIF